MSKTPDITALGSMDLLARFVCSISVDWDEVVCVNMGKDDDKEMEIIFKSGAKTTTHLGKCAYIKNLQVIKKRIPRNDEKCCYVTLNEIPQP